MKSLLTLRGAWILVAFMAFSFQAFPKNHSNPFILNSGQWNGPFSYKAEFNNLTVFAEDEGFTFVAREGIDHHAHAGHDHEYGIPDFVNAHAFRLRFQGAAPLVFTGEQRLSAYHNYFLGRDRSKWRGNVPLYAELLSNEFYDGISLRVASEQGGFKYDYIIKPESDPSQIRFNYSGNDNVSLVDGKLILETSIGDYVESLPVSYQIINGEKIEVECTYVETQSGTFGFSFPRGYDDSYPLVIDPVLIAATLSGTGAGGSNFGHGATFDLVGNIYTHAISFNSAYPTTEGAFQEEYGGGNTDVAISKLNPDGSELLFASFIGGAGGDTPFSTIVNANQEIYIYGRTNSTDFPTSPGAFQSELGGGEDIFVTGLSIDGTDLVGSTYLGGSGDDGFNTLGGAGYDALRGEINLNLNGEVFVSSSSSSENFPTTLDAVQPEKKQGQDAVVVKLNDNLSEVIWSTFIGSDASDMAYGLRVKDDQTVVIGGAVGGFSSDGANELETTDGAFQPEFAGGTHDGFIAHLSADGDAILECTFLGLSNRDLIYFIDLDSNDDVWVYMFSESDWETTDDVWGTSQSTLQVHKLSEDLSELLITSYVSDQGSPSGNPVAFMVDLCNGIYISAFGTEGGDFVASEDALFSSGGFYVGVFEPDMEGLIYGTYYTGNHVDGGTSRFDTQG
ncbi:MAG: hypothetical protein WBG42_09910, partial [Cryomorphaceae bacterium]